MNRDETKRAAEEALRGDAYGATDRELWLDIERRKYARAFLAQCEREEKHKKIIKSARLFVRLYQGFMFQAKIAESKWFGQSVHTINEIDAAIKAIEEGRG